jgi:pyridoxine 4-dehydrogenase
MRPGVGDVGPCGAARRARAAFLPVISPAGQGARPRRLRLVRAADTLLVGDLQVGRLGFGAMRLTGPGTWGEPRDRSAAKQVLRRAVDLGVNLIDTADAYGPGTSERLIAEALHPYPEDLVIATKGGRTRLGPYQWGADCRPASLRDACEASLRRLRLERIDLYQLHTVDPNVPLDESVGTLAELQAEGKVRHIGVCNVSVEQLSLARSVATIASVQNRYSLADRTWEAVVRACGRDQLAFLPWMPLSRGALARGRSLVGRIAETHGARPAPVALAWLLQRFPHLLPIPGTSSLAHLEENVGARDLRLTAEELASLDRYVPARRQSLGRRLRHAARPLAVPILAAILSRRSNASLTGDENRGVM